MVPLTPHGTRELLIGTLVLALLALALGWAWWPLALLTVPLLAFLFSFFRDPERVIPTEQHVLVSPADGMVSDITPIEHDERLGGPAVRVGIFLSVFNVHVNRAPCDGVVQKIEYKKGKFINALKHAEASEHNEANSITLVDPVTRQPVVVIRQIVGLIARRIVFPFKEGEQVRRGDRIGMMKFGSRTELYIPTRFKPDIKVTVGSGVRGGTDIIAYLREPIHTTVTVPNSEELEPLIGRNTPA